MSRFRAAPRQGHMDRVRRIIGYLSKMRHAIIRIRTTEPDYSSLPEKVFDWDYTCYHGSKEEIPLDIPKGRGKRVILTSFVDANLLHDLLSGKAVTGILHMANKTPVDWFAKLQATVETATFGSEYVAARTCTEQQIDLRNTFRYLGVPVEGASFMFGDNESVVNTASVPHSRLGKRLFFPITVRDRRSQLESSVSTGLREIPTRRTYLVSTGTTHRFGPNFALSSSGMAIPKISKSSTLPSSPPRTRPRINFVDLMVLASRPY